MTYNVFSGTLNPTQSINHFKRSLHSRAVELCSGKVCGPGMQV